MTVELAIYSLPLSEVKTSPDSKSSASDPAIPTTTTIVGLSFSISDEKSVSLLQAIPEHLQHLIRFFAQRYVDVISHGVPRYRARRVRAIGVLAGVAERVFRLAVPNFSSVFTIVIRPYSQLSSVRWRTRTLLAARSPWFSIALLQKQTCGDPPAGCSGNSPQAQKRFAGSGQTRSCRLCRMATSAKSTGGYRKT
jgi:hypothetical protein